MSENKHGGWLFLNGTTSSVVITKNLVYEIGECNNPAKKRNY